MEVYLAPRAVRCDLTVCNLTVTKPRTTRSSGLDRLARVLCRLRKLVVVEVEVPESARALPNRLREGHRALIANLVVEEVELLELGIAPFPTAAARAFAPSSPIWLL